VRGSRRAKLATAPPQPDLLERALAALQSGDLSLAAALATEKTKREPEDALAWEVLSIARYRRGVFDAAIDAARRAVRLTPQAPARHANLGVILRAAGQDEAALAAYEAAIAADPAFAPARHNLGNLYLDQGRLDLAEASLREAVGLAPDHAEAWRSLGIVLQKTGRLDEAVRANQTLLALAPDHAQGLSDSGAYLMALDRHEEALGVLERAIAVQPDLSGAHANLGALHLRAGRLFAAMTATERALALDPNEHRSISNLAVIMKDMGRFPDAEGLFRRALALKPDYATGHANLLFCLNYHPDKTPGEVFDEYRRWDEAHAQAKRPAMVSFDNERDPERRLRVGFVSPDFREHSAGPYIAPLLGGLDRTRLEIFCYAEVVNPDAATERFKAMADGWRVTQGLSDEAVAAMIRADRIDILVDLGGHTSASRLAVFARKPAPIQIEHFLGHGYTSGLSAMDAFLCDAAMVPADAGALFSERVLRLPRIPLAYAPPPGMPEPTPCPALAAGHVTFGYFGRTERINDKVVAAWAAILNGVPGSRLTLNTKVFGEAACRALFAARFAAHGIGPERLDLVYTSPQPRTWAAYGGIDIALDPFPHNAGATTIEALWLGVPVLSVKDRPSVGRFGASILGALDLPDWVAEDVDAYVALAIAKAQDLPALAALRASLRQRFLASPLADPADLGRHLGQAFRDLWRDWVGADQNTDDLAKAAIEDAVKLAMESDRLRGLGQLPQAEAAARRALEIDPGLAAAANHLGNALVAQGRVQEADEAFDKALALEPDYAEAYNNRALSRMLRGLVCAAEDDLRRAMALRPDLAEVGFNLGGALQDQGRLEEALAAYRAAVDACPDQPQGHGALLFCLGYQPQLSPQAVFAEFRRWDERHARPHTPAEPRWDNAPDPDRRLRIGYVSPDFCNRSARHFIEPMLAGHDRSAVEVFCYAEVPHPDAATARFQALADHWRPTVGLSSDEMATLIRRDRIDVLIDLGGHTARNRLLALARKPAPVQIEHFLGHGYTSGLSAMDAFLADDALAPPGSDELFAERVVRLDRIPIAYRPPDGLPPVAPSPALRKGHVTFGHFGRTVRINDAVVETWAAILRGVPGSRLALNTSPFSDPGVRRRYLDLFAAQGVDADRLDLVFTHPQPATWDAYGEIDIGLDPFPHNAGTTTIEALWLGVPVVSLADRPSVGRFGACILRAAGLSDWVADTREAYVAKAVAAASDLPALAALRDGLRQRMEASPLADGAGLARILEATYRQLWRDWCEARNRERAAMTQAAVAAYQSRDFAAAADGFKRLAEATDGAGDWSNLGACLSALGRSAEAEDAYRRAIALDSGLADAQANLGNLLTARGRMAEAESAYLSALSIAPQNADVWRALAICRLADARLGPAREAVERALAIAPGHAQAHETLASLLRHAGEPVAATQAYGRSLDQAPDDARTLANMAVALQDLALFPDAEGLFRRALALKPDYATGHANLLFCLNYHPDKTPGEVFDEYRRWDEAHAQAKRPAMVSFDNERDPERRLRVGFVSPDFREHSAGPYIAPLLGGLDRTRLEIFCYAEVVNPDAATERFKAMADGWRVTQGLSDEAVAAMIRADRIDILVDLGGHTSASRLAVFARKPAPIQIEHFLGHGYTSGLSAMDAFLCDAAMVPADAGALFSERVLRLPRIPLAYAPPPGMPEPTPCPALAAGHVTFGYFGRTERINDKVVAAWAAILNGVPGSRLTLNTKVFGEAACRALFAARFAAHGIGPERLDLVYTSPQPRTWAAYGGIDIALDPFPHNAGATTIEALWLGVPVLSVKDRPSVGRFGASILGALDLPDWVAEDVDAYVALAIAKAQDLPALAALRASLRQRFLASPLADPADLGRHLGQAFRDLWRDWVGADQNTDDLAKAAAEAFVAGDYDRAQSLAGQGLSRAPRDIDLLHVRGLAAFRLGRLEAAAADVGLAVEQAPERAELRWNLTAVLRMRGDLAGAEAQGLAAVALAPQAAEARNNLGLVYQDQNRAGEAEACFLQATALRPDQANGWSNLALVLNGLGRGGEGEAAARRAIALNPSDANALNNLGSALMHQDRLEEAAEAFRQACALSPGFTMAHSNLLFCLNYSPTLPAEAIFQEYRRWDAAHARPFAAVQAAPFAQDRDPERRLRVGYVSPDFRHHAVSFFIEPLLAAHDRSQVELFCYAEVRNPDATTERFKALADHWRSTVGLSDDEMAALVRRDRIDVLVDLAGHTASNRLLVFARRAAPVQVAQIVGSGATTGMSAMDGYLIDGDLAPPGAEALFSERLVRLGRIPLVYAPPPGMPQVAPSPALRNGYVTFGCFSRTARINDGVLDAWAAILRGTPQARLMLNAKPFQEQAMRELFAARFAARDVAAERLDLVYTSPQPRTWDAYGEIDIALDPFPHNAGTTTFEALWLGAPVVSLAARPPVGRFGQSILGAVGLNNWVAADVAGYVAKAVAAASDIPALAALRAGLRERMERSPLRDAAGLARKVEEAYRVLWRLKAAEDS
jgi:predicted O-linked N-acetylglucosamine transferase (SPINDLY family)